MQTKGILWNKITRAQQIQDARRRRVSNRAIPRLAVRQPEECEAGLSEVYLILSHVQPDRPIENSLENAWVRKVLERLSDHNPYRPNDGDFFKLLKILDLVTDERRPTNLLRTFWKTPSSVKEQASKLPDRVVPKWVERAEKVPLERRSGGPFEIYVGNLQYDVSEREVFHTFSTFGTVIDVKIPVDFTTRKGRGFGFVEMAKREDAERAIREAQGRKIQGRGVVVNWKR